MVDGAPARFLSVSDNPTVGEIRDALKVSTIEWCFDDSTYAQAADSRCLSGLVADGLAASGTGPTSAIKVQTRGATAVLLPQLRPIARMPTASDIHNMLCPLTDTSLTTNICLHI